MFEVDGTYANRKGKYTVLGVEGPIMTVRYEDGTTADLRIDIQHRIWENILAEQETQTRRTAKKKTRRSAPTVNHFIKVINVAPGEDLVFPGWEERVVMTPADDTGRLVSKGDRMIYYAPEAQTFFAVVTITGDPFTADPKKYTFTIPETEATFFQIDVDADTDSLDKGVTLDSVELESRPNFAAEVVSDEMLHTISEDDFELLAELLAEVSEEDENDEDDVEDEEFDEDDD